MKKFKEYLESYDGGNFVGLGGFSIGSLDSYKPIASLGPSDRPPNMYPQADKRGTTATYPQKNIKKKKRRTTDIEPELENTALYNHLKEKGLIKTERTQKFKNKIIKKIQQPISDYLKKKKLKER
jgi:hypothetical protein